MANGEDSTDKSSGAIQRRPATIRLPLHLSFLRAQLQKRELLSLTYLQAVKRELFSAADSSEVVIAESRNSYHINREEKQSCKPARFLTIITIFAYITSCGIITPYVWVDDALDHGEANSPYRIRPGDELKIHIWGQESLSSESRVRRDGRITLELAGDVHVAGLTPEDAALAVTHRLEGLVKNPNVTIAAREGSEAKIYVIGEVRAAGEQALRPGDNIMMVIARAGGLSEFADSSGIYLLRGASPTQRIRFSYADLARGKGKGLRFPLQHGDIIIVE